MTLLEIVSKCHVSLEIIMIALCLYVGKDIKQGIALLENNKIPVFALTAIYAITGISVVVL